MSNTKTADIQLGKKLGQMIVALKLPRQAIADLLALLPEMSLAQINKLARVLEKKVKTAKK